MESFAQLAQGQKLADRYTLEQSLHVGKYGAVWLAQDDALKSVVVLKATSNNNTIGVNLLKNEYHMCSRCIHSGVVRAFELHKDNNHTYLSLEYLSGGSLLKLCGRPPAQFAQAMIEVADALYHVHKNQVVHRDVKLSNILIDSRGHARLIDFGIASTQGQEGLHSGGSPRSSSPQQLAGQSPQIADDLYSFGVALYRLLENDYPNREDLHFSSHGDLPRLVADLMHPDPAQRPADMEVVAHRLKLALADQSNATLPPDEFVFDQDDDAVIDIISVDEEISTAEHDQRVNVRQSTLKRGGIRKTLPWLLLYSVAGGLALFYLFPKINHSQGVDSGSVAQENQPVKQVPNQASISVSNEAATASSEPWKLAQEAKLRKDAEAKLEALLTKQFYLEDKQVALWAGNEFEQLKQLAIEGDQQFRQHWYAQALEKYTQGDDLAANLSERARSILEDTLREADKALSAADSTLAAEKFALAKKIDPQSQAAITGAQRAANLDQVLTLVTEGEMLEQQGKLTEALKVYREAQQLDSAWQPAIKGVHRINRQQANSAYARHMSNGHRAMEAGDFAEAHSAFERAKKIRPDSSEVTEAFGQLETAIRLQEVSDLKTRARELERSGDLRGAEAQYQAALAKDDAQQSSQDDLQRVRGHAEVDEALTALLNDPVQLGSDQVYREAEIVLQRAQAYMTDPAIAARVASLEQLMSKAKIPIHVEFVSDGQTDVLLYRVGHLGNFTRDTRDLRPGEYTAVGTRTGFRDVRVKFTLAPGDSAKRIEIMCREAI